MSGIWNESISGIKHLLRLAILISISFPFAGDFVEPFFRKKPNLRLFSAFNKSIFIGKLSVAMQKTCINYTPERLNIQFVIAWFHSFSVIRSVFQLDEAVIKTTTSQNYFVQKLLFIWHIWQSSEQEKGKIALQRWPLEKVEIEKKRENKKV